LVGVAVGVAVRVGVGVLVGVAVGVVVRVRVWVGVAVRVGVGVLVGVAVDAEGVGVTAAGAVRVTVGIMAIGVVIGAGPHAANNETPKHTTKSKDFIFLRFLLSEHISSHSCPATSRSMGNAA